MRRGFCPRVDERLPSPERRGQGRSVLEKLGTDGTFPISIVEKWKTSYLSPVSSNSYAAESSFFLLIAGRRSFRSA